VIRLKESLVHPHIRRRHEIFAYWLCGLHRVTRHIIYGSKLANCHIMRRAFPNIELRGEREISTVLKHTVLVKARKEQKLASPLKKRAVIIVGIIVVHISSIDPKPYAAILSILAQERGK
jgi:hypothetical protein